MNNLAKFLLSCMVFGVGATIATVVFVAVSRQALVTWASVEREQEIQSSAFYDEGKRIVAEYYSERNIYLAANDRFALLQIDEMYLEQFKNKQNVRQKYLDMKKWQEDNGHMSIIETSDYYDFSEVIKEIEDRKKTD